MIKIDSQGHEKWNLPYGGTPHNGYSAVVQTDDEGYVLTLSSSAGLVRTDTSGSERWILTYADINAQNTVGQGSMLELYTASSLIRTTDGGYATVGTDFGNTLWLTKISPEPDFQPPVVFVLSPQHKTYDTGDISLTFTVNEPASWIGYSLDGRDNVTITGNITLAGLSNGDHNLTVYARDTAGNYGTSETINFSIVGRFPFEWLFAGVAVAAAVIIGVLLYFKRHSSFNLQEPRFQELLQKAKSKRNRGKQNGTNLNHNESMFGNGFCSDFLSVLLFFIFFQKFKFNIRSGSDLRLRARQCRTDLR